MLQALPEISAANVYCASFKYENHFCWSRLLRNCVALASGFCAYEAEILGEAGFAPLSCYSNDVSDSVRIVRSRKAVPCGCKHDENADVCVVFPTRCFTTAFFCVKALLAQTLDAWKKNEKRKNTKRFVSLLPACGTMLNLTSLFRFRVFTNA